MFHIRDATTLAVSKTKHMKTFDISKKDPKDVRSLCSTLLLVNIVYELTETELTLHATSFEQAFLIGRINEIWGLTTIR